MEWRKMDGGKGEGLNRKDGREKREKERTEKDRRSIHKEKDGGKGEGLRGGKMEKYRLRSPDWREKMTDWRDNE